MKNKNQSTVLSVSTIGSYGLLKLPQSKIDPYTRATIGFFAGMAMVVSRNPIIRLSGFGIMLGSILTLDEIVRIKGAKIVQNESNKSVSYLHEDSGVGELHSKQIPDFRIDGLTSKGIKGVYKFRDGVYVKILSDGTITETFGIGKIFNRITNAGFKTKPWVDAQTDKRWLALYEKSLL